MELFSRKNTPRKAFVGLSSPLSYDYMNETEKIHELDFSSPNPILEDALGLITFYDEILFLSRRLCPLNMRDLDFVRFLEDELGFFDTIPVVAAQDFKKNRHFDNFNYTFNHHQIRDDLCEEITGGAVEGRFKYKSDHHTHNFKLGDNWNPRASSFGFENVLADFATIEAFELEDHDLVCNSITSNVVEYAAKSKLKKQTQSAVLQSLIVTRLPNYLGPEGPFHECLLELRAHEFIQDMRKYIDEVVENHMVDEAQKIANEVERIAREYRDKVFRKHLSGRNEYFVLGKAAILDAIGMLIPGLGTMDAIQKSIKDRRRISKVRWTAFVVDLDRIYDQ